MTRPLAAVFAILSCVVAARAHAYEFLDPLVRWPDGSFTMRARITHPNLGASSPSGPTWTAAFEEAADDWNGASSFLNLTLDTETAENPCDWNDEQHGVGFKPDVCGTEFGDTTIAVALWEHTSGGLITEANIIFKRSVDWDVYSGPLSPPAVDFRRVAVHEIGHLWGLAHEDQATAIMSTYIGDLEHPQSDDLDGIAEIYDLTCPGLVAVGDGVWLETLDATDCFDTEAGLDPPTLDGATPQENSLVDFYRVFLGAQGTLSLELSTPLNSFDPVLQVLDTTLAVEYAAEWDTAGSPVGISPTLAAGSYAVVVRSISTGDGGDYALIIEGSGVRSVEWVSVGDPGSDCVSHPAGCFGSVDHAYRISRYETTNGQYAEFLNAVAATDTNDLYNALMGTSDHGGISRSGTSGSYTYQARAGRLDQPVNYVSFYDSLRFANWMQNGQPIGAQSDSTTEDGAYDVSLGSDVARRDGASVFVPSEDEWYKAAYYDAGSDGSFDYPAGSDAQTICSAPGATANTANCDDAVGSVTEVAAYTGSRSPCGTFDQGGNVREWTEATIGSTRVLRGGGFGDDPSALAAWERGPAYPTNEYADVGFRLASVPEPGADLLCACALLALALLRRQTPQRSTS